MINLIYFMYFHSIKIKFDGFFTFHGTCSGIGDIFRDYNRRTFFYFKKPILADLTIRTEVITLQEGILIAIVSHWTSPSTFSIESNFLNVVA